MAYVNVAEWKTEQVCEWLKGLDNSVLPYVHSFTNHNVSGQQLLSLRPDDLEHLGVLKLGHQEIILEAVEYLRNFHYELDRENLQLLALRLSCQAHSLQNELSRQTDSKPVKTQTLSDVASVIMAVKPLVRWLDRPPFSGQLEYNDKKAELMKLALEMATCAQRDRFAEKPIEEIRTICGQLAKLADYIIQDINDPMILQPSSLDLATLKKKPGDDLGFYILPSFHGAHQIAEIKFGSAAHQCGKMEEGDEIVQVNYQTVVGWERKNLLELFRESPAEILLTLKRRPRHTKVYGQIYIKPYRLPSNKKTCYTTRWQHNLPSPRPELLTIPDFTMPLPRPKNPSPEPVSILDTANILDTLIIDSSDSDSETEPPLSIRLYSTKPRNSVQRRATITGASPTTKHGIDIEQFWKELKQEHSTTSQLRDKAASCAHGLDNMPSNIRAQTCIEQSKWKKRSNMQNEDKKVQFQDKFSKCDVSHRDNSAISITNEKRNEAKAVQNNDELLTTSSVGTLSQISQTSTNVTNNHTTSDTSVPLDECNNFIRDKHTNNRNIISSKETSVCSGKERGRLDKSYSAPAYDSMDSDGEMEHRRQKLFLTTESSASNVSSVSIKTDIQTTSASTEEERMLKDADDQKQGIQVNFDSNTINTSDDIHRCVTKEKDNKSCSQSSEHLDLSHAGAHKVVEGSPKISIEDNQSNNKCIITTSIVCNKKNVTYNMNHKIGNANETHETENVYNPSLNHEIIDDKLESTNSSTQNDKENDRYTCQYGKILQTFTPIVQVCGKNATKTTEHITQNFVKNIPSTQISQSTQNDQLKVNDLIYHENIMQTCKDAEARKAELCKNVETNPNLIPPDPPPRKYFTRIEFNRSSNDTSLMAEEHEKSIPEKRNIRQDLKNVEYCMDNYVKSNSDHEHTQDYFYACNSFTEKLEYIDFANTFTDERRPSLDTDSSHSEYNDKQIRENKSVCDKYEPVTEKSVYVNSTTPFHDPENCFYRENMDSPDGSCTSKQFLEHTKSKVTEKEKGFEKGVVNKAMMVARSIGLHGSLSKSSSNSPRSNRKRSILIARKRNISVKDIGTGDLEGWLTYRSRGAGGAWAKAWFVLKCSSLYRFKIQNSIKADCLIVLTGFTVARASEVKSRKFAFKVYHTGTVFYFAADTEDSLTSWLDAISKATLGADSHSRNSALFSETDESDDEQKSKKKTVHSPEYKPNTEKSFGSLKKIVRKDSSSYKEQEMSGASLDRKYLKFLGTKHHNIPVPTAQFRSYRRVLPTSTTNKKQDSVPNSPDLQMTIAGSTFYGLCASHSATDMSYGTPDMCDYRRTTDRSLSNRNRRPEELQGFITLEEFMLNQQEDQNQMARNRPVSPRITPLTGDHVHVQHRNFHNNDVVDEQSRISIDTNSSTAVHSRNRNNDEILIGTHLYGYSQNTDAQHGMRKYNTDFDFERNEYRSELQRPSTHKNLNDFSYIGKKKSTDNMHFQATKACNLPHCKNGVNKEKSLNSFSRNKLMTSDKSERQMATSCEYNVNSQMNRGQSSSNHEIYRMYDYYFSRNANHSTDHVKSAPRCLVRKDGSSGSSHDLTYHNTSETLKRAKKEASINRKGSFNLSTRRNSSEKHWLDSLRRIDEKDTNCEKMKLKNVAQYQPPPIPSSPYEQEGMSAAFEMHLDRGEQIQKTKRLKNLFGNKSQQKPSTLDLPKDTQKTLLGSPRLHRALFRDKCCNQSRASSKLQSPRLQPVTSFNGNNPSMINQIGNSVSSASDSSPDTPPQHTPHFILKDCVNHPCQKGQTSSGRNFLAPPTLPYIPPPTSPPPDYPGLEYPPVFEPGTYSLLDASLLRNRNKSSRDTTH